MIDYSMFGKIVREIRKRNKLSRNEVYDQTGIALETQRSLENGTRITSLASLETLSHYYKTDLIFLLSKCRTRIDFFSDDLIRRSNEIYNSGRIDKLHDEIHELVQDYKDHEYGDKRTTQIFNRYITIYEQMNKMNYKFDTLEVDYLKQLLDGLSIHKRGFTESQEFFDIEIIFANMLCIRYRLQDRFRDAEALNINILQKLSALKSRTLAQLDYTGAAYVNLATLYHREDRHVEVITLVDTILSDPVLRFSRNHTKLLLARKIIAMNQMNPHDSMIPHLVSALLIDETPEWLARHRRVLGDRYGIKHPLLIPEK